MPLASATAAAAALVLTGGALLHADACRACPAPLALAVLAAGVLLALATAAAALRHPAA